MIPVYINLRNSPCQTIHARKNCVRTFSCMKIFMYENISFAPKFVMGVNFMHEDMYSPTAHEKYLGQKKSCKGRDFHFHTWKYHFHA